MSDQTPASPRHTTGEALPVFPFTDEQVAEVVETLREAREASHGDTYEDVARAVLSALARVMRMESTPDPMGCPRGYGYRSVRGVTESFIVAPDGSWRQS